MDKRYFESEMRFHLSDLPDDTVNRYVEKYSNIIDGMVSSGLSEEQAIVSLGDPVILASKIRRSVGNGNGQFSQEAETRYSSGINDSLYNVGKINSDYGDGFSAGTPQNGYNYNGANGYNVPVTGTVRNAPFGGNGYNNRNMPPKSSAERVIFIVIACVMFMPMLIGLYCGAVGVFIAGVTLSGVGFWPLCGGAAMTGVLMIGAGLMLLGIAILMMMGLNRLIKLVTGQYHLIK